jgi:DnaK suppressor protein
MASKPRAPEAARTAERPGASKAPTKPGAAKKAAVPARGAPAKAVPSRAAVPKAARVAPTAVAPGGAGVAVSKAAAQRPSPSLTAAPVPQQGSRSAAGKPAASTLAAATAAPAPRLPVPRPAPPTAPRDVVAAHEFLLSRSSIRSEAPVTVNGKRLLTEEQLLKMSDADYMNEDQLAFFRHRLQQMEREILSNADSTTEHLRETVIVPDPADRATIEEEHALELRTRDRERKLLKKVQSSITRIDAGDYGYCEETGEPIGIPRLLARPTATLSLEAQQRREMKQKMYGD